MMTRRLLRKEWVQLCLVALIGWGLSQFLHQTAPMGRDVSTNQTAQALINDRSSPALNVPAPTLTLVVFADYQCPACKFANPAMEAAVAKDGHVRVVFRDWPMFGTLSERAARVAIASDRQGIYTKVHGILMNGRRAPNDDVLRAAVEHTGGNWGLIQQDLRAHAGEIERQLNRNKADAYALGITGTPAYLVGPLLVTGAITEAQFTKTFAQARAK